jgi:hypothetical protein
LYTNIPNYEAEKAAYKLLSKYRDPTEQPENKTLIKLLDYVLKYNNFQFNGTNYLQVGGTAMGTKVAPSLANAFMDDFEHKHVYNYHNKPIFWKRYIDDIFCIWTKGQEELQLFVDHLNNCHNSIKFTVEKSTSHVNFLDTVISLDNNRLISDLYTKPTDTHSYLRYDSAHHPRCKQGIPYGQFLRIRRICHNDETYDQRAKEMTEHFIKQGYPNKLVTEAKEKAKTKTREELLNSTKKDTNSDDNLFLITTYQLEFSGIKDVVQKNWDLLKRSVATKELSEKRIIFGYRRPKNLRDLLVKSKLDYHPENIKDNDTKDKQGPLNPCDRKNCRYCPKLNVTGKIKSSYTGREYIAKHNVTCKSNNLIYCITCKKCDIQYVGQTKRRLMDRFQGHFGCVQRNDQKSDIAKHYNSSGHTGTDDMIIHILDFINLHPESKSGANIRDQIEFNWIHRLHTPQPMGLNIKDAVVHQNRTLSRNWSTYNKL